MDTEQLSMAVDEQEEGDIKFKPHCTSGGLGEFEEVVAMPKQMILITLIAQEPAIFNPKHEDYRNTLKKDDMWMEISKRVGWTERHCKNKWKAMRDQYCRELKRARRNSKAIIKWKYFQHLEFLRPYALYRNYRPRMTTRSQPEKDEQEQQEEPKPQEELSSSFKTDSWTVCSNSSQMNESTDVASQILDQISQSENNDEVDNEEPQDDEDDDPIHTFLNIESYFEKELITMIQSEQVLYNSRHQSYRNAKFKLKVWEEIARKLKRTVRQCRLKWKALRDQYIREHKRLLYMGNGKNSPRWKHYDALSFLEKFIRRRSEYNCRAVSIQKAELDISIEHLDQEQMITPSTEEDQDITQYILGDDETSQIFDNNCRHSRESGEQETVANIQNDKHNNVLIQEAIDVQAVKDDNDEVGAFFRAIAMKIRKAKMSPMAFTELQIDILRVITKALQDP